VTINYQNQHHRRSTQMSTLQTTILSEIYLKYSWSNMRHTDSCNLLLKVKSRCRGLVVVFHQLNVMWLQYITIKYEHQQTFTIKSLIQSFTDEQSVTYLGSILSSDTWQQHFTEVAASSLTANTTIKINKHTINAIKKLVTWQPYAGPVCVKDLNFAAVLCIFTGPLKVSTYIQGSV